jgi:hypothetical protein
MSSPTFDPATPIRIGITRCGPIARACLGAEFGGPVTAVFRNCFYVESGERLVCIGNPSLGPGPLNALCDGTDGIDWLANGFPPGTPYRAAAGRLIVGGRFVFCFAEAETWHPPRPAFKTAALRRGLARLERIAEGRVPDTGLAPIVFGGVRETDAVAGEAREPLARLRRWLFAAMAPALTDDRTDLAAACRLLGLGPGLTPSGDDFLGGVMIALDAAGLDDVRAALRGEIRRRPSDAVGPISRAHLEAAAEGLGAAALHDMIAVLASGRVDGLRPSLDAVDRLGHTSGWDALAGIVTVLRVVARGANGFAAPSPRDRTHRR